MMFRISSCIDKITVNRLIGVPLFLFIMYCMFFCSVCIGGVFQQFFDLVSRTFFIDFPSWLLLKISAPVWLQCIIAQGLGLGINVTITFIPVLAGMFLFLSFLENSGYIVRAAFVMNNFMRYLGLPGKSFIPMLMGFGCNVSAVLSAKILPKRRERILTIIMIPFISCGAKLAVYAIFAAAFFPSAGQNIVFLLYMTGILIAIFTGMIFKGFVVQGGDAIIKKDFPLLSFPKLSIVCADTMQHLRNFIFKAGSIIVPLCMIISILGYVKINATSDSILEMIGKKITPLFQPIGIQKDNWPAVVGLMSGIISKEVIIGTLTTLYEQENLKRQEISVTQEDNDTKQQNEPASQAYLNKVMFLDKSNNLSKDKLILGLQTALWSVPNNIINLKNSFLHPFSIIANGKSLDGKVLGTICLKFNNSVAAFSYLLFILLYCPCVSVVAMIMRELGAKWALFIVLWTTSIAYIVAAAFYQIFTNHNVFIALIWGGGLIISFAGLANLVKIFLHKKYCADAQQVIATKVIPIKLIPTTTK